MKLSYNEQNDFVLTLSGEDFSLIRYALANEVERQQSKAITAKRLSIEFEERDLKEFIKLNDELERITQEWVRK